MNVIEVGRMAIGVGAFERKLIVSAGERKDGRAVDLIAKTPNNNAESCMIVRAGLLLLTAAAIRAQTIPGAVLAQREPHHHLAYEDSSIRVLRVRVPAHDTTLLHEHDPDYFWIALGPSTLVNAKPGVPDATVTSADLAFHYSVGKFAHVARNPGSGPFDNITVELLDPQTNVRNLCEPAVADKPLDCGPAGKSQAFFSGATEHPALTSDQTRVSLLTIAPGGTLRPTSRSRRVRMIALDTTDARRGLVIDGSATWTGGAFRAPPTGSWALRNESRFPVRVIAVVKP